MKFGALLSACALALASLVPVQGAAQSQTVISSQAGVSLFTLQPATAASTSSAVRLPNFATAGVLTITYTGIAGSPSGCVLTVKGQSNNSTTPTATLATIVLAPSSGVVEIPITPSVAAQDQMVVGFSCSVYPTGGAITVSLSPYAQPSADPCQNPGVAKSSVSVGITTATTTQLVALAANKKVYVCHFGASLGASTTVALEYGTGSTCGTGTTVLSGAIAGAGTIDLGFGGTVASNAVSNALCALSTGTGGIQGVLTFVQQ